MMLLRRLWERLSLYLPLLFLAALALVTFWLVKNTPSLLPAMPIVQIPHEPDYVMRDFSIKTFDETGRLKSEVLGAVARHFPDTDTTEIDAVNIRVTNPQSQVITATANQALTNGDGSEVQLFGNAQVVREANAAQTDRKHERISFQGEFLHVFTDTERVKSHLPVVLRRGQDELRANSLEFDNLEQVLLLRGRVQGQLVNGKTTPQ
jgi:lipopolysaccharide export system protein LptC